MSPAARTVVSMQLSQLVQACHRRAAARPLSRTSDKPSRRSTRSAHRELFRASHDLSTSNDELQCLPNASSSVDHVPKSTRAAFLCGVKGHTWNYCAEEGEPGDEATLPPQTLPTPLNIKTDDAAVRDGITREGLKSFAVHFQILSSTGCSTNSLWHHWVLYIHIMCNQSPIPRDCVTDFSSHWRKQLL